MMETLMTLTCSSVYILTMLTLFLPSHLRATYDYNNWIEPSSPKMPRAVRMAAVGYNSITDTIWIVGGTSFSTYDSADFEQLMSYDINSNSFTNYSSTALSGGAMGYADFYTQIGDIIYMVGQWGNHAINSFSTFNVNTTQYTHLYQNNDENIIFPYDIWDNYGPRGCLASTDDALFVLGSGTLLQVFNLTTSAWTVPTQRLNEAREQASCIVHPYNHALYVIGGLYTSSSIEKLYVGDLAHLNQYEWEFIDSLPYTESIWGMNLRSVVYENDIICIGGYISSVVQRANDQVFVIDVTSDNVRLAGYLPFGTIYSQFVVANNVLYSFGGSSDDGRTFHFFNEFQYLSMDGQTQLPTSATPNPTLVTLHPTEAPSHEPTKTPTLFTESPTDSPSTAPSLSPTSSPSLAPTLSPTFSPSPPSLSPSLAPTSPPTSLLPSLPPSASPSFTPTFSPSFAPSHPSIPPTNAPSNTPTVPTQSPTHAPSTSPSLAPSLAPSSPPSSAPSSPPTSAPSLTPTQPPSRTPSQSPSSMPSVAPSLAPSVAPSLSPIQNPSRSPSTVPSYPPSNAPSDAPSNAPTNNPIASDDFDSFLEITYVLNGTHNNDKEKITGDPLNVTHDIENVVKNAYVADGPISYDDFLIDIQRIQGTQIAKINALTMRKWTRLKSLELQTLIECNDFECRSIREQSKDVDTNGLIGFAQSVTDTLKTYFGNEHMEFTVKGDVDALEIVSKYASDKTNSTSADYVLYGIISICGLLGLIGILAFLFNKGHIPRFSGSNVVDNGKFAAVFVFTLQLWDFYSDVNLSVEIWNHPELSRMLVSAIGSTFFVVVPYVA
eukprot:320879_1